MEIFRGRRINSRILLPEYVIRVQLLKKKKTTSLSLFIANRRYK